MAVSPRKAMFHISSETSSGSSTDDDDSNYHSDGEVEKAEADIVEDDAKKLNVFSTPTGSGDGVVQPRKVLIDNLRSNVGASLDNSSVSWSSNNNALNGGRHEADNYETIGVEVTDRDNQCGNDNGVWKSVTRTPISGSWTTPKKLFKVTPRVTNGGKGPARNIAEFREMHDLTRLDCITLENVLECLQERYRSQQYYTYAGPILLSLNSCQKVPRASLVEDVTKMTFYFIQDAKKDYQKENQDTTRGNKSPHVYDIGLQCLKNLVTVGSHQVVLVSGESGAGKTTATQQLIKYLTENNSRNFGASVCSNLDKKIYFATIILESFGNAKTQQNPNSSRFGRLVQLNYEKASGQISGAEIHTYLLEKHRVAKYNFQFERSFHIFYYVLLALKNKSFPLPQDITWDGFKNVAPKHLIEGASECDIEELQRIQNAIHSFNMDLEFCQIVGILLAMISLLNISFVPDCDSSSEDEFYDTSSETSANKTEFKVSNNNCSKVAAELLGVKEKELVDILVARKITAGSSHRHSIFRKPCEGISECEERLHALTSFIYDRVFSHVLDYLNTGLKGIHSCDPDYLKTTTICLLDLYGFENFSVNHLEQVCINYANERLQQINVSIVKSYYEQSISENEVFTPPTELNKIEDELYYRIDELHSHIFSFLDEECLLKRVIVDDKNVLERMTTHLKTKRSKFIRPGRPNEKDLSFIVSHYATQVEYTLSGMVRKNKDHIPPEFQDILKCSSNSFVHSLFKHDLIRSRNTSGATPKKSVHTVCNNTNARGKTILTRFKASVEELMSRLKKTENNDVHFIRCIRPNSDLRAGSFCMSLVEKQLHACGIADVVRIAGNGYPIRVHTSKLLQEFPKVVTYFCKGEMDPKVLTVVFSNFANVRPLKFGKSLVFCSEESWKMLKRSESFLTVHNTRIIQRAWKKIRYVQELSKQSTTQHLLAFNSSSLDVTTETGIDQISSVSSMFSFTESEGNGSITKESAIKNLSNIEQDPTVPTVDTKRNPRKDLPLPLLHYGNGVASRFPIHSLPIKLYLKKTCLRAVEKPPRRLIVNGVSDAFEDHGIVFIKTPYNCPEK